jgi:hypothetical protein
MTACAVVQHIDNSCPALGVTFVGRAGGLGVLESALAITAHMPARHKHTPQQVRTLKALSTCTSLLDSWLVRQAKTHVRSQLPLTHESKLLRKKKRKHVEV